MSIVLTPTTPTVGLIDVTYAQTNAILNNLSTDRINALIGAASGKIRRYCKRWFNSQTYTRYFSGGGYPFDTFYLPEIPTQQITRLATNPVVVMNVQNTATTVNQRATAQTTTTGLVLFAMASGIPTMVNTITWTTYPTVQAVANAVNALGNGWTATISVGYALFPSADFKPLQGAVTALVGPGAGLEQYIETPVFGGNGIFTYGAQWIGTQGWRLDAPKGVIWGQFPPGQLNIRCDFQGGFDLVPDPVQEACVLVMVAIQTAGKINPQLKSERSLDYSYELQAKTVSMPGAAIGLLSEYVDWGARMVSGFSQ